MFCPKESPGAISGKKAEKLRPCLVHPKKQKVFKIPVTSNLATHA